MKISNNEIKLLHYKNDVKTNNVISLKKKNQLIFFHI